MPLFKTLFVDFKWYRKKIGGTWYKVYVRWSDGGMEGPIEYWTNSLRLPDNVEIIRQEEWPVKKK